MLFTSEDMREPINLDSFETLPIDESVSELAGYPMTQSDTGKYVISLESAINYCDRNSCGLDDMMMGISEENNIPIDKIAFCVRPSSLYLNEMYNQVCDTLRENGVNVLINSMPYTAEATIVETAIQRCLDEGNTDAIDTLDIVLNELFDNFLNRMKNNVITGATAGAGRAVASALRTAGGAIVDGAKSGLVRGGSDLINNTIFSKLDKADPNQTVKVYNSVTGQYENKPKMIRNARVTDFMRNHGVTSNNAHAFVNSTLDNIRNDVSNNVVRTMLDKITNSISGIRSPDQMIDALERNARFYGQRYGSGQGEPGQRGLIAKVLDKLKALKDKLIARFRGGNRY